MSEEAPHIKEALANFGLHEGEKDSLSPAWYKEPRRREGLRDIEKNAQREDAADRLTRDHLRKLRHAAMIANYWPKRLQRQEQGWCFAHAWVLFLCTRTQDTFFLQHFRVRDAVFYEQPRASNEDNPLHLQPKPHADWGLLNDTHDEPTKEWQNRLPWLEHPERLTVAELELALAIFEWDPKRPRFVWWIERFPHILRRVHQFLLRRYCWTLLGPFEEACNLEEAPKCLESMPGSEPLARWARRIKACIPKADRPRLMQAPFRAALWWWAYPRMWGMVALGNFALLSGSIIDAFFFGVPGNGPLPGAAPASWCCHVFIAMSAFAAMWILIQTDVFKQNHGLMASPAHACPRVCGLLSRLLAFGLAIAFFSALMLGRLGPEAGSVGVAACARVVAILAHGVVGTLVGIVLQWFWNDFAATEPV